MALARVNRSPELPTKWRKFGAGTYNFVALGLGPAVRIIAIGASNWTLLKDCADVDEPMSGLPDGFVHDTAGVTEITCSAPIVAYFNPGGNP